jgi:hypothetical protein
MEIELKLSDSKTVSPIIEKHHYSHKATPNHFLSFEVNNGLGAIQLGYGIRPHKKGAISNLITKNNYCEFDRMWLSDELPKNSESQVISKLLSYLKNNHKNIHFVITYADGSAGNRGTIYQATNAIEIDPIPCDFYLLESGERVHPVSMWHRHKSRAWNLMQKLYPNIKHIKGTRENKLYQYRYLYILNKAMRKKYQAEIRQRSTLKGRGQFPHSAQFSECCNARIINGFCESCIKDLREISTTSDKRPK